MILLRSVQIAAGDSREPTWVVRHQQAKLEPCTDAMGLVNGGIPNRNFDTQTHGQIPRYTCESVTYSNEGGIVPRNIVRTKLMR